MPRARCKKSADVVALFGTPRLEAPPARTAFIEEGDVRMVVDAVRNGEDGYVPSDTFRAFLNAHRHGMIVLSPEEKRAVEAAVASDSTSIDSNMMYAIFVKWNEYESQWESSVDEE